MKQWQTLFASLSLIFVVATIYEPYQMSWLLKVLPMILLVYVAISELELKSSRLFVLGLLFSLTGDFILDYSPQSGFIFGLGSFFIAHIFYLLYFGQWQWQWQWQWKSKSSRVSLAFLILVSGGYVFSQIMYDLGELFSPVIGYGIILTLMALASIFSKKSNYWFILGGISFVISDSILGINKFSGDVAYSHVIIMVSYYFAQFALLKGALYFSNITIKYQ